MSRLRRVFVLIAFAFLPTSVRAAERAVADCTQIADPNRTISGCTLVLQRGGLSATNRALALSNRGNGYTAIGDLDRALDDLNQSIALNPSLPLAYLNRGVVFLKKGDSDRVLADSNQAILLNPRLTGAYAERGFAYSGKAEYDRALAEFDQAILLDPKYAMAYVGRGGAHIGNSEFDNALADADHAVLLDPKLAVAYVVRAVANLGKGDPDRALADSDQALAATPNLALGHVGRGIAYFNKGDNSRAFEEYTQAISLDPKLPVAYSSLAELEARQGQFDKARDDAETSLRLLPTQAPAHAFLSFVYGKKGDFQRASTEIEQSLRFDPKSLAAILYRGELRLMKGDPQSALEDFESVLARIPKQPLANAGRDAARKALTAQAANAAAPTQAAARASAPTAEPSAAAASEKTAPAVATTAFVAGGKRVALIVANGAYKGAPLGNPIFDADIVAASLANIGFAVKVSKNADLGGFDAAVSAFAQDARGADVALFYFAGHGFTVNEGVRPISVLMSTSADVAANSERVLRSGGIPLDDIVGSLAGQARATLVFVDACRNDPRLSRAVGGKGRGFDRLEPVEGGSLFIGLSTRLGETAQDGDEGKGSPFARAFAKTITTKGMRIDDAFRQLRDAVKAETSGRQIPDIVQDDLPNGAITLVNAGTSPAQ